MLHYVFLKYVVDFFSKNIADSAFDGNHCECQNLPLPTSPRPTAQVAAGDSPQRLRGTGAGSPLAEQTPILLPLKGKRTGAALLNMAGNNAFIESAQGYVSEQRTVDQRRQTLASDQPLAEGKGRSGEKFRRSITGRTRPQKGCGESPH